MRAGETYDYYFEVDGERHYDFDCEFDSVEIVDAHQNGAPMMPMKPVIAG